MSQLKKVILIPHWVSETLKRHGLNISDVSDFAKLRQIVSLNDLAGMLVLNQQGARVGLKDHSSYECSWMWSKYEEGHPLNAYLYNTLLPFAELESTKIDLVDRLFSPDARSNKYEKPFIIYDLASDHIGVVIYPGFFTGEDGTVLHQFTLLEEVIKALYVYAPLHEVASTPVFRPYLGLLSKKRIMV